MCSGLRVAIALASVFLALAVGATGQERMPIDLSGGEIEGKRAISFWSILESDPGELSAPEGCEAHLVPASDLAQELVYPCGQWLLPKADKYKFWLEGEGWMGASTAVLHQAFVPFTGKGKTVVRTLVPAGRAVPGPGFEAGAETSLRLLHLESHNRGKSPLPEMSRRPRGLAAKRGGRKPEGEILAALFDSTQNRYLALLKPLRIFQGEETQITFAPLAKASHLLVVFERPGMIASFADYDLKPRLLISGAAASSPNEIPPDVLIPTVERVYVVWYGLRVLIRHPLAAGIVRRAPGSGASHRHPAAPPLHPWPPRCPIPGRRKSRSRP